MAHIRIGEELFNVAVDGPRDAPVVMLSNSLAANLRMWEPQMPALTQRFRVIRYDSRGHGESVADPGAYTIERLGRDALAILDKLGVDKVHWVGLSKGGMVGQWLLAHAPSRIQRAVLANTSAYMAGGEEVWNGRARAAVEHGMPALVKTTLDRWFTADFRAKHPETMKMIGDMIATTPAEGYAACCLAIRDMDQRASLRSIRRPVLVLAGEHDPSTVPAAAQALAAAIPGARLLTLRAAHLSNVEDPETFSNAVIAFLTGQQVGEPAGPATPPTAREAPPPAARPKPTPVPTPRPPVEARPAKVAAKAKIEPVKKAVAATPPAKKAAGKKTARKKTTARRAVAKKSRKVVAGKRAAARKPAAKKTPAKKAGAKKSAVRKAVVKKSAGKKKTSARKAPAKKKKKSR